jgi:hypothetical protein
MWLKRTNLNDCFKEYVLDALTCEDHRAHHSHIDLGTAEYKHLGREMTKRDEVREEGHIVDAANTTSSN